MIAPGLHPAIPRTDYHNDQVADRPTLSASIAHTLTVASPLHAQANHPRLNPSLLRREEPRYDLGTAAHAWLLEGADIVHCVDHVDWRTKDARDQRDEARAAGKIPLLAHVWADCKDMVEAARQQLADHDADPPLFTQGKAEQTIVWDENGVVCRARLDWLRDDCATIDDYKTTSASADPDRWERTMYGIGADIQVAFYLRGVAATCGLLRWPEFRFVVQETYPPYALSVIGLAPSALELANRKVDRAIGLWRECLGSGRWPGYPVRVAYVEAPGWEEARFLERQAMEEAA